MQKDCTHFFPQTNQVQLNTGRILVVFQTTSAGSRRGKWPETGWVIDGDTKLWWESELFQLTSIRVTFTISHLFVYTRVALKCVPRLSPDSDQRWRVASGPTTVRPLNNHKQRAAPALGHEVFIRSHQRQIRRKKSFCAVADDFLAQVFQRFT